VSLGGLSKERRMSGGGGVCVCMNERVVRCVAFARDARYEI
jgi:hypothetical protein